MRAGSTLALAGLRDVSVVVFGKPPIAPFHGFSGFMQLDQEPGDIFVSRKAG